MLAQACHRSRQGVCGGQSASYMQLKDAITVLEDEMKKIFGAVCLLGLLSGCTTTGVFGGVDDSLVGQIPSSEMGEVYSAMDRLDLAEEELKLAELRTSRAERQEQLAEHEEELAENRVEHREIEVEIAKLEALEAQNLGDPAKNVKALNDYRADKLKNETERFGLEAEVKKTRHLIEDLDLRIAEQERMIRNVRKFKAAESSSEMDEGGTPEPVETDLGNEMPSDDASGIQSTGDEVDLPDYLQVEEDPDVTPVKPDHPEDINESGLAE